MPDLAEAMKYVGSTARDTGVSIKETTAMIMTMGQAGIKGSMAGVAIENMLRYLGRAVGKAGTGQQHAALAELGMSMSDFVDQKGNMKSMVDVMYSMGKAIRQAFGEEGTGGVEKQNILSEIFGVRGKRSASVMLRMVEQFREYSKELNNKAPGFAGQTTMLMMDTLQGKILTMGAAWSNMWKAFSKSIEPILKPLLDVIKYIGQFATWLFSGWKGTFFSTGIAGFIVIKTVSMAFRAVLSGIVLIQRQMAGSMSLLSTTTVLGYMRMTAAARAYHIAAGTMNVAGTVAAGGVKGVRMNAAGRFINSATGRFVSGAAVTAASRAGLLGGLNATLMSKLGTGVLSKVVGFLGGPVGIALSFVIPGLLSLILGGINKNRKATEDVNSSIKAGQEGTGGGGNNQRYIQAVEFLSRNRNKVNLLPELAVAGSQRQAMDSVYVQTLKQLMEQITNTGEANSTFIINLDNQKVGEIVGKNIMKKATLIPNR